MIIHSLASWIERHWALLPSRRQFSPWLMVASVYVGCFSLSVTATLAESVSERGQVTLLQTSSRSEVGRMRPPSSMTSAETVKGRVVGGQGYRVAMVDGAGQVSTADLAASGAFSFKVRKLRGATLFLVDDSGRAFGPVALAANPAKREAYLGFSGKLPAAARRLSLGDIELRNGYAAVSRRLAKVLYTTRGNLVAATDEQGSPVGAASGGVAAVSSDSSSAIGINTEDDISPPGSDSDGDGIIDPLDPDVDGDGLVNIADPDYAGSFFATYSSLVLDMRAALNANISSVSAAMIDAVIGGANGFNISFWQSLPPDSRIRGGHVRCASSNQYCNATSGVAVYGGITESNPALKGQLWRTINTDGSGFPNLELIELSGGRAVAFTIEPRVGTSGVRPGDTYLVNFTDSSGAIVENRLLVLSPFLVTVPALKSFTRDGATTTINYGTIEDQPGVSQGNPILTDSSGRLSFEYWRPQRLLYRSETPRSSSDLFRDLGRFKYGVVFEGVSRQFTCARLYSNLSTFFTEQGGNLLGTGDSPYADQGAQLYTLRDGFDDDVPSADRTLGFTVDLRTCLTRADLPLGTYQVRLVAQGEAVGNGANSSSQLFWVSVS